MLENNGLPLKHGIKSGKSHIAHEPIDGMSDGLISIDLFKQALREIIIEFLGLDTGLSPRSMYPTSQA
jgi:hypothetical protein